MTQLLHSGDGWFRRFKKEYNVKFLRKGQENKYKFDVITLDNWASDNQRFLLDKNDGKLCTSPASIFVVECTDLIWHQEKEMKFAVVISFKNC